MDDVVMVDGRIVAGGRMVKLMTGGRLQMMPCHGQLCEGAFFWQPVECLGLTDEDRSLGSCTAITTNGLVGLINNNYRRQYGRIS